MMLLVALILCGAWVTLASAFWYRRQSTLRTVAEIEAVAELEVER